jgi:hypothetical protein
MSKVIATLVFNTIFLVLVFFEVLYQQNIITILFSLVFTGILGGLTFKSERTFLPVLVKVCSILFILINIALIVLNVLFFDFTPI